MSEKQTTINLLDELLEPVKTANDNYKSSTQYAGHSVASLAKYIRPILTMAPEHEFFKQTWKEVQNNLRQTISIQQFKEPFSIRANRLINSITPLCVPAANIDLDEVRTELGVETDNLKELLKDLKGSLESSKEAQINTFKKYKIQMESLKETYIEDVSFDEIVKDWSKASRNHYFAAVFFAFATALIMYFCGIEVVEKIEGLKSDQIEMIATNTDQNAEIIATNTDQNAENIAANTDQNAEIIAKSPEQNAITISNTNATGYNKIRESVLYLVILSLFAFAIRSSARLMFSFFHSARDYSERANLTRYYVNLLKTDAASQEDRAIIMQSLFSRSDTGLLKDDGAPIMPGNMISKSRPGDN